MQFLARSLSKSIRPSLNSTARKSWALSQHFSTGSSRTHSAEEWPKPTEVPYQPKIENTVNFIGYVSQPLQVDAPDNVNFWAGTIISHAPSYAPQSELESPDNIRVPVVFEGDLAKTANCHLKIDDRVHITGKIFVDMNPFGFGGVKPGQAILQVMVREFSCINDSKAPHKVLPTPDFEHVLKHSASVQRTGNFGASTWFDLLDQPDEWYDYRESKQNGSVNPKHPDFKKKDGTVALWLNRAPNEILSDLKDVKCDTPVQSKYPKQKMAGVESWNDLVENMNKWWDNRLNKRNPKAPDFKHKETGAALWLSDCPSSLLEKLPKETSNKITSDTPDRSQYAEQKNEESWKDLLENLDKWYDNRLNKKNPKAPDFKHKGTGAALWLSSCPSSVLWRLPDPKEADDTTVMRIS